MNKSVRTLLGAAAGWLTTRGFRSLQRGADGAAMADVVAATAQVFGRAVVMPNLSPPVKTVEEADDVIKLAMTEGLDAHASAVTRRLRAGS